VNRSRRFFDVLLREERGDRIVHLPFEFCSVAGHLRTSADIWSIRQLIRHFIANPKILLALREQPER
jgi:hypothetical protein